MHWLNRQTKDIKQKGDPDFWDCIKNTTAELVEQYDELTDELRGLIDALALEDYL